MYQRKGHSGHRHWRYKEMFQIFFPDKAPEQVHQVLSRRNVVVCFLIRRILVGVSDYTSVFHFLKAAQKLPDCHNSVRNSISLNIERQAVVNKREQRILTAFHLSGASNANITLSRAGP